MCIFANNNAITIIQIQLYNKNKINRQIDKGFDKVLDQNKKQDLSGPEFPWRVDICTKNVFPQEFL